MRPIAWGCSLLLTLVSGAGCGAGSPTEPAPNLLLVVIDTLRRDHSSAYGYERDTTPSLRRLAEAGARVEFAYAPLPATGPTLASLFTALPPIAHGVVKNGLRLHAALPTLAERLRARGYRTGAIVSSFALAGKFGYARGFEGYQDDFEPGQATLGFQEWEGHRVPEGFDRRARPTSQRAIRWLGEASADPRPFFLFVHYFDPHDPYVPPARFRRWSPQHDTPRARAIAAYDGEVAYADDELGRLLAALERHGLGRDTLVAVTADHGEGLLDHGYMFHDIHLYEEALQVPLVLRFPGRIAAGRSLPSPTSLVDLAPALLALLGLETPDASPAARALTDALLAATPPRNSEERPIFFQRRPFSKTTIAGFDVEGEAFGVRFGRWKYIEAGDEDRRELFDLVRDPGETRNQLAKHLALGALLSEGIRRWRAENETGRAPAALEEADRARLRAMGYAE